MLYCSSTLRVCVCAPSLQSCPSLCDPMDCSQPDSSVHGIFQASILEWVDISSSREYSRVIMTVAIVFIEPGLCIGELAKAFSSCSWGFSRQECWSCLPLPSPGDHVFQNSPLWPDHLGWPYMVAPGFTELDEAVIRVISLISFLQLWFSFCLPSEG